MDDVKCKTTYKNSFTTKMETQCTPTFDTSCSTVLQTAYKQVSQRIWLRGRLQWISCQECKTIRDVECRIVNIDKHGKYLPKVRGWQHRSHSCLTRHLHCRKSARMSRPKNVFLSQSRWRPRSVSTSRPRLVRMFQLWLMSLSHRNSATESQGESGDW